MGSHERQWVAAWLCERFSCSDAGDAQAAIAERIATDRGVTWRTALMKRFGRAVVDEVMLADRQGRDRRVAAQRVVTELPPDELEAIALIHAPVDADDDPLGFAQAAAAVFAEPLITELDDVRASLADRLDGRWLAAWMDGRWLAELQRRRLWREPVFAPKSLPTVQDLAILFALMVHRHTGTDPQQLAPDDVLAYPWFWADGRDTLRLLQQPLETLATGILPSVESGWSRRLVARPGASQPEATGDQLQMLIGLVRSLRIDPEGRPLSDVEIPTATLGQLIDPTRRPWQWPDPVSLRAQPNPFRN